MNLLPARLLVVTDRHQASAALPVVVSALLDAGVRWIWLRDRDLPGHERHDLAMELCGLTRTAGATLSIGADVGLAAAVEAPGVHLRQAADVAEARRRLGRRCLVGVSAHSVEDVRDARDAGADYATVSPIFASASKPSYGPELGTDALRDAATFGLPVVALGGVTPDTSGACLDAGASAVAMMGPPMRAGAAALPLRPDLSRRS